MKNKDLNQLLDDHIVVIYDGECGFCDSSVQFILQQKPNDKLRFVSFQSETGENIRRQLNITDDLDSIIIVEHRKHYKKSQAIFRILNYIQSPWRALRLFRYIPTGISNFFYDIIAKHRYRIKNNTCRLLTAEERKLFI